MADLIEKIVLKHIDHVMVVIDESKWRLEKLGVPSDRISVVSNTPPMTKQPRDKIDLPKGLKLVYIGQLQHTRGIGTVIEGFHHLLKKRSDIHLYIAGSGAQAEYFKRYAEKLKVTDNVHFLGWVKPDLAYRYINSCQVGIVPPLATRHIISTIPNKIFDYMLCGLAVLVSDAAPLKRVVEESRCGWWFKAGKADAFAEKVLEISQSDNIDQLGANGRKAVMEKYNWASDCQVIGKVIDRFAAD
jgi:glycosyltransferase involved in cell wall biosynthesis